MKKILIRADLIGRKCKSDIMSIVAKLEGIKSMDLDPEKCTLTVIGDIDPVLIVCALRKKCMAAKIVSVEDEKPKEEKEEKPKPCEKPCERPCIASCYYSPCKPNCYYYSPCKPVAWGSYEETSSGQCTVQ